MRRHNKKSLKLDAKMQEDGAISLDAEGTVSIHKLQIQYEGYGLQQEKIVWQGRITGNRSAEQKQEFTVDGELAGTSMALDDRVNSLQLLLGAFNWQGKAGISQQVDSFTVTMESEFEGDTILAKDEQNNLGLLDLEKFNITGIQIAGLDDIRVAQVDLKNLRLVEKKSTGDKAAKDAPPPLLQTTGVDINNISLKSGTDISIGNVKLQDVEVFIRRDKEGNWQVMPALPVSTETTQEQSVYEVEGTVGEASPLNLRIDDLQVSGKNSIRFELV